MALRQRLLAVSLLPLVVGLFAGAAQAGLVRVVEYERRWGGDGYFLTAFEHEVGFLDAATPPFGERHRSGVQFNAYDVPGDGLVPVCRFFNPGAGEIGAHFLTAFAHECEFVRRLGGWTSEGFSFYVALPDGLARCPTGTAPVYRTFDGHRHRLTYSREARSEEIAHGATPEGVGSDGVAFCVPVEADPDHARLLDFATGTWTFAVASGRLEWPEQVDFSTQALVPEEDDRNWAPLHGIGTTARGHGNVGRAGRPSIPTGVRAAWQPYTGEVLVVMGQTFLLRLSYRGGHDVVGCWQRIEPTFDVPYFFWSQPCQPLTGRRR